MATGWGYAKSRVGFDPNDLDYKEIAKLGGYEYKEPKATERFSAAESEGEFTGDLLDENTIVSFTINFEPNESVFSEDRYGGEFERAIRAASTFGNARIVIRGHADPTKALGELVRSGIEKGLLKRTGTSGNYRYFFEGRQLDIEDSAKIVELIESGAFSGGKNDPAITAQAALTLSKKRAEAVKQAVTAYAAKLGVNIDLSQIVPVGAGISDPVIPRPRNEEDRGENRRVEFRIVRVDAESISPGDFDF